MANTPPITQRSSNLMPPVPDADTARGNSAQTTTARSRDARFPDRPNGLFKSYLNADFQTKSNSASGGGGAHDPLEADGLHPATLKHFGLDVGQVIGLRRVGDKQGGSREASALGGVYENTAGEKMLIKFPARPEHAFAEFLNSAMHRAIVEKGVRVVPLGQGAQSCLASFYVKNSVDLYAYALEKAGIDNSGKRPVVHVPGKKAVTAAIDKALLECAGKIEGSLVCSLLFGNHDVHTGNIMAECDADGVNKGGICGVSMIDFGWGSRETSLAGVKLGDHFGKELHPNSMRRRLPVIGPTNHHRDIPEALRSGPVYIDQLIKAARHNFEPVIDMAFEQGLDQWGPEVIAGFAKNAGLDLSSAQAGDPQRVKAAYLQRIGERQESMKRYAADLALGLFTLQTDPADNTTYLESDTDAHDRPAVNDYLTQGDIRKYIQRYVDGQPDAAKLRNHALDHCQDSLREILRIVLDQTAPTPAGMLQRPLRRL